MQTRGFKLTFGLLENSFFFSLVNQFPLHVLPTCAVHNSLPITCNIIVLLEMIVVQFIWRWLLFADNRDGHQEELPSRAQVVQIRKKESTLNKWSCQQRAAWIHLLLMLLVLPRNAIIHLTLFLGHDFHLVPLWLKGWQWKVWGSSCLLKKRPRCVLNYL